MAARASGCVARDEQEPERGCLSSSDYIAERRRLLYRQCSRLPTHWRIPGRRGCSSAVAQRYRDLSQQISKRWLNGTRAQNQRVKFLSGDSTATEIWRIQKRWRCSMRRAAERESSRKASRALGTSRERPPIGRRGRTLAGKKRGVAKLWEALSLLRLSNSFRSL